VRGQRGVDAVELLEREARPLDDDIVDRRSKLAGVAWVMSLAISSSA